MKIFSLYKTRPVWAEINLDAIKHNIQEIRRITNKNALITGVVKADAYGHGAVAISKVLQNSGVDRLAVAFIEEAIELRKANITIPILVLGYTEPERSEELIRYDIDQTIYTLDAAKAFSHAAGNLKKRGKIHIKVDTGMGRIGLLPKDESIDIIEEIVKLPNLEFEGMFTHFSTADEADKSYTKEQFRRYNWFRDALDKRGLKPNIYHCANSPTIIDIPEMHLDMVRAGIIIYGLWPSNEVDKDKMELKPAMSLKARVTNVKLLGDNEPISYCRNYFTQGTRKIATIPIGFADGFNRLLSGKVEVLVHGKRVKQVGNICMDQCMLDVTGIDNVIIGDEVVLFGEQMGTVLSVNEMANLRGTVSYEVISNLSRRVPRVYYEDDKIVDIVNYLYK